MSETLHSDVIRVRIPGDARYLALIRSVIVNAAIASGFADDDVDKIEMAVDEACTNVLDHAYRFATPKPPIDIEVRVSPERLVVDIIDRGVSFDFNAYIPPKFPDHWLRGKTRGLGVFLIKHFMDEAKYERLSATSNRLRLIKNLQQPVTP
ncbi:MAG TPA: ATP-binding protein [Kiritimatiellia bacterium]|nr:ATP-binding protein [Kiritimatiellia bacterium]